MTYFPQIISKLYNVNIFSSNITINKLNSHFRIFRDGRKLYMPVYVSCKFAYSMLCRQNVTFNWGQVSWIGVLQSMRIEQTTGLNGNRYATFHQLTAEQAKMLHEDERLYDVCDILNVGDMPLGNCSLTLYLREYHNNALDLYSSIGKVKEGRLPETENEIALPEDVLGYLGLNAFVGDTISLNLSTGAMDGSIPTYDYSAGFTLTAILESSYLGYTTGMVDGIVGNATAKTLLPDEYLLYSTDFKTHNKADFQKIVDSLAATLNLDDFYIQYN